MYISQYKINIIPVGERFHILVDERVDRGRVVHGPGGLSHQAHTRQRCVLQRYIMYILVNTVYFRGTLCSKKQKNLIIPSYN